MVETFLILSNIFLDQIFLLTDKSLQEQRTYQRENKFSYLVDKQGISNYWSSRARNPHGLSRFKWTKISVALYECLGLLKVNCKETPITGAADTETTIHKISGNDEISHTKCAQTRSLFVAHTNPMAFLQLSKLKQCNRDIIPLKYETTGVSLMEQYHIVSVHIGGLIIIKKHYIGKVINQFAFTSTFRQTHWKHIGVLNNHENQKITLLIY